MVISSQGGRYAENAALAKNQLRKFQMTHHRLATPLACDTNPLYLTAARENQDRIVFAVSAAGLGTGSKGCSGAGPGSSGACVGNPSGWSTGLNVASVAN